MALGEGGKSLGQAGEVGSQETAGNEQGEQGQQSQQGSQGQQGAGGADGGSENGQGAQAGNSGQRASSGSPDQLADLRESLQRRQRALEQRFGQGPEGQRQGSGNRNGQAGRQGKGQGNQQGQGNQAGGHLSRQVQKGEGGAGRGGKHEKLLFGDEAEMDPDRLAFQALPEGHGGESAELWGLKAADPQVREGRPTGGAAKGTGAQGDATAGHSAAPLLPRNRELVKRYFGGE